MKERFLKFEDDTTKKRASDLALLIIEVLESYDCKTKLVAQRYDGAAVMASGLNGVQALIKKNRPAVSFCALLRTHLKPCDVTGCFKNQKTARSFSQIWGDCRHFLHVLPNGQSCWMIFAQEGSHECLTSAGTSIRGWCAQCMRKEQIWSSCSSTYWTTLRILIVKQCIAHQDTYHT